MKKLKTILKINVGIDLNTTICLLFTMQMSEINTKKKKKYYKIKTVLLILLLFYFYDLHQKH